MQTTYAKRDGRHKHDESPNGENESPTVAIAPESVRFLNVRNTSLNTKVTTV